MLSNLGQSHTPAQGVMAGDLIDRTMVRVEINIDPSEPNSETADLMDHGRNPPRIFDISVRLRMCGCDRQVSGRFQIPQRPS